MQRTLLPLAALGAAATVAACATTAEEPRTYAGVDTSRQCFFENRINGYSSAPDGPDGEERIIVSTGPNDDWLFELRGACHDIDFAQQIGFDLHGQTSICTGRTETLLVPSSLSGDFDRCQARLLGKVTDMDLLTGS